MIAIVCGGRDYTDKARVKKVLDAAVTKLGLACIIEGECPTPINADKLSRDWALERGDVSVIAVPAGDNWPEAGPIRNSLMLDILCGGDTGWDRAVIAFDGGKGTANMLKLAESPKAKAANVRVIMA